MVSLLIGDQYFPKENEMSRRFYTCAVLSSGLKHAKMVPIGLALGLAGVFAEPAVAATPTPYL